MIAASPASFGCGGVTAATPGVASIAVVSWSSSCNAAGSSISTASSSGPLKPGPNPSESRSYARRRVSDVGAVPSSGNPSFIENSGIARTSRIATAPMQ